MAKWTYQVIDQTGEYTGGFVYERSAEWIPELNLKELGYDGWELVSVVPIAYSSGSGSSETYILRHYFKKQIE